MTEIENADDILEALWQHYRKNGYNKACVL